MFEPFIYLIQVAKDFELLVNVFVACCICGIILFILRKLLK